MPTSGSICRPFRQALSVWHSSIAWTRDVIRIVGAGALGALLGCAFADEPVVAACPPPIVDTSGWTRQTIPHAGAAIRLPTNASSQSFADLQYWGLGGSEVMAEIGEKGNVPMFLEDITLPFSIKAQRSECTETVQGQTATIVSYYEQAKTPHLGFGYVAGMSIELVPGSWLNIGTISEDAAGQARMLAALRTIRLADADGSLSRAAVPACASTTIDTSGWQPIRLHSIPVSFLAPRGAAARSGYSTEVWDVGAMRVDFVPLRIRTWRFDPALPGELWCQMTVSGRTIELQVQREVAPPPLRLAKLRAYVRLSPDTVLHVYGWWIRGDDNGAEILQTLLSTIRY